MAKNEKEQQRTLSSSIGETANKGGAQADLSSQYAIKEAEKLLRPIAYYQNQFAHMTSLEEGEDLWWNFAGVFCLVNGVWLVTKDTFDRSFKLF